MEARVPDEAILIAWRMTSRMPEPSISAMVNTEKQDSRKSTRTMLSGEGCGCSGSVQVE
jgi:hypothetical protein